MGGRRLCCRERRGKERGSDALFILLILPVKKGGKKGKKRKNSVQRN